jgi:hypothetical protein
VEGLGCGSHGLKRAPFDIVLTKSGQGRRAEAVKKLAKGEKLFLASFLAIFSLQIQASPWASNCNAIVTRVWWRARR